jgi:DNA-binding transcriptional ArsR family regulator
LIFARQSEGVSVIPDEDQMQAIRKYRAAAEMFSMLADPTRLELLVMLAKGPTTVGDLIAALDASGLTFLRASVSNHLALLRRAEYASSWRDEQRVVYRLTESGAALAAVVIGSFLELPMARKPGVPAEKPAVAQKKAAHPR